MELHNTVQEGVTKTILKEKKKCKKAKWLSEKVLQIAEDRRASQEVLVVKNLPAIQEMCIWSIGGEDPLEEEMVTHPSIPAWKIPWTEEPDGL